MTETRGQPPAPRPFCSRSAIPPVLDGPGGLASAGPLDPRLPLLLRGEEAGALASLSPDYTDVGRQLASEIESGRKSPTGIEILSPAKVNLAINLKTAGKIGLSLPAEILKTANKVKD